MNLKCTLLHGFIKANPSLQFVMELIETRTKNNEKTQALFHHFHTALSNHLTLRARFCSASTLVFQLFCPHLNLLLFKNDGALFASLLVQCQQKTELFFNKAHEKFWENGHSFDIGL